MLRAEVNTPFRADLCSILDRRGATATVWQYTARSTSTEVAMTRHTRLRIFTWAYACLGILYLVSR